MSLSRRSLNALSSSSRCLKAQTFVGSSQISGRTLSSTAQLPNPDAPSTESSEKPILDPETVYTHKQERLLWKHYRRRPIGSKRRRVAMATNAGLSFEQLPYQCFQEARKVLADDRNELLSKIKAQSEKIARIKEKQVGEKEAKRNSQIIRSISKNIEQMILEADSQDPVILKTFEDGKGDMNKPIYQHLADQKWREYKRKVVLQRVTQMFVTPDVLPTIDPVASVEIRFPKGTKVEPGSIVDSRLSQYAPVMDLQVYDKDSRLVTVVFVDSDVPNVETDGFTHRCHGIFSNIEIDAMTLPINLSLPKYQEAAVVPWTPPTAQKGSPYHRISAWVLQQANVEPEGAENLQQLVKEADEEGKGFNMRSFVHKTQWKPIGVTMFRTQWDDGMLSIMNRYNIPGAEVELKRKAPERLPYKKKDPKRYR